MATDDHDDDDDDNDDDRCESVSYVKMVVLISATMRLGD